MTIGSRIRQGRNAQNLSQEYLAAQLGVSRQAVSKWEQGQTEPDTKNLIALAGLLGCSVAWLATGQAENTPAAAPKPRLTRRQMLRRALLAGACALALCLAGLAGYICTRPVAWDAGACGGGFAAHIFDKYQASLVEKFIAGADVPPQNVQAVRGSQAASWEGRTIHLSFTVTYTQNGQPTTQQLRFTGRRLWWEVYRWGGAILAG